MDTNSQLILVFILDKVKQFLQQDIRVGMQQHKCEQIQLLKNKYECVQKIIKENSDNIMLMFYDIQFL